MTKTFGIDEESLVEEEKRLALEVRHYELILKQAKVDSMKNDIEKLHLKKLNLSL